jgi:NitT/TauT family transport system permease protein
VNDQARHVFGEAAARAGRFPRPRWADLVVAVAVAGALFGVVTFAREWTGPYRAAVEIDLSPGALPGYALLSLARGLAAYLLSLAFTLAYATWAARDRTAERILLPALDVLQSIPVLGFMPGLVLALVAAFPGSNAGLELASVIMIFTGQAWNMTFAYFHSLQAVPADLDEVARLGRYRFWQRFRWLELPHGAIGLTWNSMMSMAGGWFFLMVSEAFVLGDKDFRLPGLGSYMSAAAARGDGAAMAAAVATMALLVVALDQLLWRPVVVWAQRFRLDDGGEAQAMESWFLALLRRSEALPRMGRALRAAAARLDRALARRPAAAAARPGRWARRASLGMLLALLGVLAAGAVGLARILARVPTGAWAGVGADAGLTLLRVLAATALGTLWTVPAGLAIGLSPRLSRLLQPVVQVVASFPAPMLFPAVVALLHALGMGLGVGSVLLMLLGTQWYVLFNVVAGATAIPADLREAARVYRLSRWRRFTGLYLPAVFPYLVTGWITAAGGAWNASIVSEYVAFRGQVLTAHGLGARISAAAAAGDYPLLAASVAVMAAVVVAFNRLVWHRLHGVAQARYTLSR